MIIVLGAVFVILFILIGGERGVKSLLALIFNIAFFVLDAFLLCRNWNPYLVTVLTIAFMSVVILFFQNGVNIKTKASFLSIVAVTLMVLIFAVVCGSLSSVGGYNELNMYEDEVAMLSHNVTINMKAAAVAMAIVGITGAVIDLSIAIASALYEVWKDNSGMSMSSLYVSGMRLGRNIFSTNINTLFFAAIGESLFLFLEIQGMGYDFERLINSKAFFQVIYPVFMSGAGCALIIPVTAWIMSTYVNRVR